MKEKRFDVVIIGGGSAGLSAAVETAERGLSCVIIEREPEPGGILNQCIHNGFGLHYFKEELTGPEFAEKLYNIVKKQNVDLYLETTVMEVQAENEFKDIYGFSKKHGLVKFICRAIILAMGCRERNRGNIGTPGTRPSGIFTAGLAQRLVNIDGYIPGKKIVIVGSGDIGLIMARRMKWTGAQVSAVVEIQPYPAGLTRNIVQCLNDFNIPLYLSHVVSNIYGKDRVESVDITPLKNGRMNYDKTFRIECDTILLSVGLVPDNEISKKMGVVINPETNGPFVDSMLMTSVKGVFACGNVLHVHDLVDFVAEEAGRCGGLVFDYLKTGTPENQYRVISGSNIKYTLPNSYLPGRENKFYLRPLIVKNHAMLVVKINGKIVMEKKLPHIQPSEMISFILKKKDLSDISELEENRLEAEII